MPIPNTSSSIPQDITPGTVHRKHQTAWLRLLQSLLTTCVRHPERSRGISLRIIDAKRLDAQRLLLMTLVTRRVERSFDSGAKNAPPLRMTGKCHCGVRPGARAGMRNSE
jgi:hypothetical protein